MKKAMSDEFSLLWQAFIDGGLTPTQAVELERYLQEDAQIAALAAEYYVEHRLLSLALCEEKSERFTHATLARMTTSGQDFSRKVQSRLTPVTALTIPLPQQRLLWSHYAFAASLAALFAALVMWWSSPVPNLALRPVATLVLADHCTWDGPSIVTGQRLTTGLLRLQTGNALVRFDGGAEVLLTGRVDLTMDSAGAATLNFGHVTVRASEEAAGFILRTPVSEVTDLGTEFTLSVNKSGATDINVIEGAVAWRGLRTDTADSGTVLHQGEGVRLRTATETTGERLTVSPATATTTLAAQLHQLTPSDLGRLISYDGFAYGFAKSISRLQDAAGGYGWRAPWYRSQTTNELPLDFNPGVNLQMPVGLLSSDGGRMEFPTEITKPDTYRDAYMRLFAEPIDLASDGVRYVSLLIQRSATYDGPTHHWFRCMLVSETVSNDRVGFGIMSNGCPHLLSRFGNSNGNKPIQSSEPYLCVFKVVCGRNTPDQTFLKIYAQQDQVDRHEPANWTLVGQPGSYNGVLGSIHINNGTDRAWSVDELRIGTTWSAVTPRP